MGRAFRPEAHDEDAKGVFTKLSEQCTCLVSGQTRERTRTGKYYQYTITLCNFVAVLIAIVFSCDFLKTRVVH